MPGETLLRGVTALRHAVRAAAERNLRSVPSSSPAS